MVFLHWTFLQMILPVKQVSDIYGIVCPYRFSAQVMQCYSSSLSHKKFHLQQQYVPYHRDAYERTQSSSCTSTCSSGLTMTFLGIYLATFLPPHYIIPFPGRVVAAASATLFLLLSSASYETCKQSYL
jgi:hypothetical protein